MRVEPYGVGSVLHVIKRGARGADIVRDEADRLRFVRILYLFNDTYQNAEWERNSISDSVFERPEHWPEREPLVSILAWTLMPNHFHLIVQEIREGGTTKFMQRLCGSMSKYFNGKYAEQGSLFESAYKSRVIGTNEYLQYVLPYVVVKNVFELYPKGFKSAVRNFDAAWQFATSYPFSSFATLAHDTVSPIVDHASLAELGFSKNDFKNLARDMVIAYAEKRDEEFRPLVLED